MLVGFRALLLKNESWQMGRAARFKQISLGFLAQFQVKFCSQSSIVNKIDIRNTKAVANIFDIHLSKLFVSP